jgi:hypothetical protein
MCTIGYNTFCCGCRTPNASTFQKCEYALLKGLICPEFQISEDTSQSKSVDLMACMAHS